MTAPELLMTDSADAFEAWAVSAQKGDRVVYAVAREFPRHLATSILAGAYLRRGLIVTVYQRQSDGSSKFIAERTKAAWVAGASAKASMGTNGKVRPADIDDDTPEGRIIRLIARHANFDKAAPTLREMAKAAGLTDDAAGKAAARRALDALGNAGHVRHENSQDSHKRRFILADGRKTGWLTLRGAA
jgi:hypothetical protein